MNVEAAFFDDPVNPGGEVGQPFHGLWEYEVVELFLANDDNQYVEIELGPWGQHIVLLLDGTRNAIKHSLPLEYTAKIHGRGDSNSGSNHLGSNQTNNDTIRLCGLHVHSNTTEPNRGGPGPVRNGWNGRAIIPLSYLPPNVTRVNAYAIHGSEENRTYEALYPVPSGKYTDPDFHRLEYFQPINTSIFLTDPVTTLSSVWSESIAASKSAAPPVAVPVEKENDLIPQ